MTAYPQAWIAEAGLENQVKLVLADSSEPSVVDAAGDYLGGKPHLLFIDSSHERDYTLVESGLWIPAMQPGGFSVLHYVSRVARSFDGKDNGDVQEAVWQFLQLKLLQHVMINAFCDEYYFGEPTVYKDSCGLGIIEVPS